MKHAQHDEPLAVSDVTKNIARVQYVQHKLAKFGPIADRPPNKRMFGENTRLVANFRRDDFRKLWMPILQESGEAVKVGERRR